MTIAAVLFDVYGTLLLPTPGTTRVRPPSFRDLLRAAGNVTDEQIVGSSRVDLQACKLEYSIVSPK